MKPFIATLTTGENGAVNIREQITYLIVLLECKSPFWFRTANVLPVFDYLLNITQIHVYGQNILVLLFI